MRISIKREHTVNRAAYVDIDSVILHSIKFNQARKTLGVCLIRTFSGLELGSDTLIYRIDLENGSVSVFSNKNGDIAFSESLRSALVEKLEWLIGERKGFKQIKPNLDTFHRKRLVINFDGKTAKHRKAQQIHRKVAEFIDWLKQAANQGLRNQNDEENRNS